MLRYVVIMPNKRLQNILFVGSYNEQYPRNAVIIKGLRKLGITVSEFNIKSKGILNSLSEIRKNFKTLKDGKYDLILLHSPNMLQMIFSKLLSKIKRIPLVFDIFLSKYLSYYHDRKFYQEIKVPKLLVRIYFYLLDILECRTGDLLLLDTYSQIKYMHEKFNIKLKKFKRLLVGAQDDIFLPTERKDQQVDTFLVGYWGSFIPLHGVDYIIQAANILKDETDIKFQLIGDGITYNRDLRTVEEFQLNNIEFIKKNFVINQELHLLPNYISKFDVGLGIFGDTQKSKIVIPNKIFEGIAMKIPMICADSTAIREIFTDNENILLCIRKKPETLANAILTLKNDVGLSNKIANQGYQLFLKRCSMERIGEHLVSILECYLNK